MGAVVALGIQATWLLDPDPGPNWSFPEAHHFNAGGWYHAGYLALVSAGSAVLAVALFRRLRAEARREHPNLRALTATGWLDLAAFTGATLVGLAAVTMRPSAAPRRVS